jgi:hypothetical protein
VTDLRNKENRRRKNIDVDFSSIPDIRRITTAKEWRKYEKIYREAISQIEVPPDLKPNDILRINALIDQIYAQARFDHAEAKKRIKRYERRLANAKKTLKLTFKKQAGQTADERDGLIIKFLETMPLQGDQEPIMTLIERWEEREIFMDAVIDNLLKITDKMINGNGALKLDAQGRGDAR